MAKKDETTKVNNKLTTDIIETRLIALEEAMEYLGLRLCDRCSKYKKDLSDVELPNSILPRKVFSVCFSCATEVDKTARTL